MKTYPLKKTILSSSLIALLVIGTANAIDASQSVAPRSYIDPITGEINEVKKLLSEMTDTEKALLSNEEYRSLKELEANIEDYKASQSGVNQ